MAENPELHRNRLREVNVNDFQTEDPLGALAREILNREKAAENKSLLDKTVEVFYNVEKGSLENMKAVGLKAYEASKSGDTAAIQAMTPTIRETIDKDRKAVQHQEEVNFYAGSFAKAVPLFAGSKSKLLLAASVGVNAAEQVKVGDDLASGSVHALMGGTKGFAMKKTFDYLGPRQFFSETGVGTGTAALRPGLEYANVATKGIALGGLSRLYETGLTASNYVDAQGKVTTSSITDGLLKTTSTTLNPGAMAMDAALFMGAHGAFKQVAGAAARATESSPLLGSVANSRLGVFSREGQVLTNAGMGATFGLATGSSQEFIRQQSSGENFDLSKIARRGVLQALTDGAAGATGSSLVHGGKMLQTRSFDLKVGQPQLNRGFAGDEAPLVDQAAAGKTVDANAAVPPKDGTVVVDAATPVKDGTAVVDAATQPKEQAVVADKPVVDEGATRVQTVEAAPKPESLRPGDGPSATVEVSLQADSAPSVRNPALEAIAEAKTASFIGPKEPAKYVRKASYEMTEAQRPVFEEGIKLIQGVFRGHSQSGDVVKFLEFGAGRGQEVRTQFEQMAKDYSELGNVQVQKLIEVAMKATPETVALAPEGVRLADQASRVGVDPLGPEYRALVEFAWGAGKGAEGPVRIVSELVGHPGMNKLLGEVYAASGKLERTVEGQKPLVWGDTPPLAQEQLRAILGHRPQNAEQHMVMREGIQAWADAYPAHHSVLHQYASRTRYGDIAAMIDARLGTDYFSRFRNSHLTELPDAPDSARMNGPDVDKVTAKPVEGRVDVPKDDPGSGNKQPVADGDGAASETGKETPPVKSGADDVAEVKPQPQEPDVVRTEPAKEGGPVLDKPAIVHEPGKITVYPERLIHDFENTSGAAKQARAHLLSEHIGSMSDAQFLNWLKFLHSTVDRPNAPPELTNLSVMGMSRSSVLSRPEVKALVTSPETAPVPLSTIRNFLAAPVKGQAGGELPAGVGEHIAYRLETALEMQRAKNEAKAASETDQSTPPKPVPIDYPAALRDALPGWYTKQLRDAYSTRNPQTGQYEYPPGFDPILRDWLELGRQVEMSNSRYRESTPPRNSVTDRFSALEQALSVRTPENAALVDRLLQLGAGDQPVVKSLLSKLDLTTNAPEHAEMLAIVAPKAENISDLKTLMDAVYFGKKADQDSYKSRKDGRDTSQSDKVRDANEALAQSVVSRLLLPGSPEHTRVSQIVSDVISGRIRDPRPDDGGFNRGGKPQRSPGGNGGEFRGRRTEQGGEQKGDSNRDGNRGDKRRDGVKPVKFSDAIEGDGSKSSKPSQLQGGDEAGSADAQRQAETVVQEPPQLIGDPLQTQAESGAGQGQSKHAQPDGKPASDQDSGTVLPRNQVDDGLASGGTAENLSQTEKFNRRYEGKRRKGGDDDDDGDSGKKPDNPRRAAKRERGQTFNSFEDLARWRNGGD